MGRFCWGQNTQEVVGLRGSAVTQHEHAARKSRSVSKPARSAWTITAQPCCHAAQQVSAGWVGWLRCETWHPGSGHRRQDTFRVTRSAPRCWWPAESKAKPSVDCVHPFNELAHKAIGGE